MQNVWNVNCENQLMWNESVMSVAGEAWTCIHVNVSCTMYQWIVCVCMCLVVPNMYSWGGTAAA